MKPCNSADYLFINRTDIAVFEMTEKIAGEKDSLEKCLQVLADNLIEFYKKSNIPRKIIFFVRSQSFLLPNVINKRNGVWGIADLAWVGGCEKTDSIEQSDNAGTYYYGIAEITTDMLFNALNYARLSKSALVVFSDQIDVDNALEYFSNAIIANKGSDINWTEAINKLCFGNNIVLKVDGEFDDRDIFITLFMEKFSDDEFSLYSFLQEAQSFLNNMKWCQKIDEGYLELGAEGILAVFKFFITPVSNDIDKELWVIVGDIPPAYLVTDYAPDAISALKMYVEEMNLWVDAVLNDKPTENLIPVNVPPTKDNAMKLKKRLDFIIGKLIPEIAT